MTVHVDPELRDPAIAIYAALVEYWREYGKAPSKVELRTATGYSLTTITEASDDLRKRGYIVAPKFAARSMRPTDWDRKLANKPPDPWAPLAETKFWPEKDWSK